MFDWHRGNADPLHRIGEPQSGAGPLFYNFVYGLVFSLLVPLYCLRREKESLASVGVKRLGPRQFAVLFAFVIFSVGGQLIPKMAAGEQIPWRLLPLGIVPLIMTTFFEEFLFRGFVQSRAEQQFGCLPAILNFRGDVLSISSGLSRFSRLGGSTPALCGRTWIRGCLQAFC